MKVKHFRNEWIGMSTAVIDGKRAGISVCSDDDDHNEDEGKNVAICRMRKLMYDSPSIAIPSGSGKRQHHMVMLALGWILKRDEFCGDVEIFRKSATIMPSNMEISGLCNIKLDEDGAKFFMDDSSKVEMKINYDLP
jgi:hypothetical protein